MIAIKGCVWYKREEGGGRAPRREGARWRPQRQLHVHTRRALAANGGRQRRDMSLLNHSFGDGPPVQLSDPSRVRILEIVMK